MFVLTSIVFFVISVSEKTAEVSRLQSELELRQVAATQVTQLTAQLETQRQKNNVRNTLVSPFLWDIHNYTITNSLCSRMLWLWWNIVCRGASDHMGDFFLMFQMKSLAENKN